MNTEITWSIFMRVVEVANPISSTIRAQLKAQMASKDENKLYQYKDIVMVDYCAVETIPV